MKSHQVLATLYRSPNLQNFAEVLCISKKKLLYTFPLAAQIRILVFMYREVYLGLTVCRTHVYVPKSSSQERRESEVCMSAPRDRPPVNGPLSLMSDTAARSRQDSGNSAAGEKN